VPEGDAVRRTAARLDRALTGGVLTRTDLRVPQLATVDLVGGTVAGTLARGKHLLTRIDHDTGAWTLHTHLRMDGSWRVVEPGRRRPGPAHQVRVVLATERAEAVGLMLGEVDLWRRGEEDAQLAHLGPDLLAPDWDEPAALARLLAAPEVPAFEALRDQRKVAGIGTIYAAETLFLTGRHPLTPIGDLPDLPRLLRRTRQLMQAEWARSRQLWVYGRKACRRCGTTTTVLRVGPPGQERPAYLCPSCQPWPTR